MPTASYWCYRCTRFVRVAEADTVVCPHCEGGFIEVVEANAPPRQDLRRRLPAAAMYMLRNNDRSDLRFRRRGRRNNGDWSPFNPVIVLRSVAEGAAGGMDEDSGGGESGFELYYDDGAGAGLQPLPAMMSEFLMGSAKVQLRLIHQWAKTISDCHEPSPFRSLSVNAAMINTTAASTSTNTASQPSASSSSNTAAQSLGLKNFFKTPEGRYKLHQDKTHPSSLLPYALAKSITQITLAQIKDQPVHATTSTPPLQPNSSYSVASSGVRYVTSKFLGSSGNGSRMLGFVGGNGTGSKANGGTSKSSHVGGLTNGVNSTPGSSTPDGKGTFLIFNVGDTLYISELNSEEKDPVKSITFGNSNPVCHAFDSRAKEGHDLLIGLNSGDVYSVSLRLQLQDVGKKLVGAHHYNKDGTLNNSRCTSISWIPEREGAFIAAHADGNLYVYEKSKDGPGDSTFPVIKDQTQFSVAHARSSKSNPIARWHICQGPINAIAFSSDGRHLATAGRDGYLRVFDFSNERLICGGKSYYGALLCCAWSADGKYILTGGEDDLVQVWSMEDRKVVAWGEGHNSWVSGVAFDSYWIPPTTEEEEDESENTVYRFGSVGQDTQLLLWDLVMDELVVPLRRPPGGSPTYSRTQSSHWDNIVPVGTLQPAPSTKDVPKLAPLVAHRVHSEPLSGVIFSQESVFTASRDGHVKIWTRPGGSDCQVSGSESLK